MIPFSLLILTSKNRFDLVLDLLSQSRKYMNHNSYVDLRKNKNRVELEISWNKIKLLLLYKNNKKN